MKTIRHALQQYCMMGSVVEGMRSFADLLRWCLNSIDPGQNFLGDTRQKAHFTNSVIIKK